MSDYIQQLNNRLRSPPSKTVFSEAHAQGCVKIAEDSEIRACGFSSTGLSFVIAMSHSLKIYSRSPCLG